MMDRWCEAIQRDMTFRQQMDPLTGAFTQADAPKYSPCALVMMDYTWRLAGVREETDALHWNVRPGHPAADSARYRMKTDAGRDAEMLYSTRGAEVSLEGKVIGRIETGAARLVTSKSGAPQALVGITEQPQKVRVHLAGHAAREVVLQPNQRIGL
jgi:hypothetical protein